MYEIWAGNTLIHSDITPLETVKAINPHLVLEDSAAGSLELTLPPINVGYSQDVIKRLTTDIVVKCDDEFLWGGRVLQDYGDFWNNRKLMCEGELAFLNDSIQPPHKYSSNDTTIELFLQSLINNHNSQVDVSRRFELGMVTVTDGDQQEDDNAIYRFTNYEKTLVCINDKLVNRLKGHLRVRHQNGHRYLDYIRDEDLSTNSQVVRFGVNLLDFSKNIDMSDLATVIVPRGERLDLAENDPRYIEGLEPYLTVESLGQKTETITNPDGTTRTEVWHDSGSMFVKNEGAVNIFGWLPEVVDWSNVTVAENLYTKAAKYLKDEQYEKMVLEVQALDMKYLHQGDEPIKFQSKLRCISDPHNMDHTFVVSKMDVDLSNPANSLYTLGSDVKLSLTQATSRINQSVMDEIDKLPSKSEILKAAERNAYQMIMGMDGGSYVHLIPGKNASTGKASGIRRIEVTDGPTYDPTADDDDDPTTDPFPDSLNRWVFTVGGLGHVGRNSYNETWDDIGSMNVALQMTGEIVADRIVVGILKAVNNLYQINTQTGYIQMEYAKIGPWYLNSGGRGLTDGRSAWLSPDDISCGNYGSTLIGMRGSSSNQDGYLEVGVNRNSDCIHVHTSYISKNSGGSTKYAVWDSSSDERLKKDIKPLTLEEARKIINNTEALTFRYKKGDQVKHYGVTAQRMEKECKELGLENPFSKDINKNVKTVDYIQFITPMLKVLQEQQKEIEEMKKILQNE